MILQNKHFLVLKIIDVFLKSLDSPHHFIYIIVSFISYIYKKIHCQVKRENDQQSKVETFRKCKGGGVVVQCQSVLRFVKRLELMALLSVNQHKTVKTHCKNCYAFTFLFWFLSDLYCHRRNKEAISTIQKRKMLTTNGPHSATARTLEYQRCPTKLSSMNNKTSIVFEI